jgi:phytoene/squalene synthetase
MDILFNSVSQKASKITTKNYSTSFSLGILLFHKSIRQPIYNIYGFVRFADEIVDTYRGNEKELILKEFREETFKAIQRKISFNPIIHSFQLTVNHYQIEPDLISAFLDSMAMDIHQNQYNNEEYKKYIYGSAKVVGLMCLHVFVSNQQDFKRLKPYALSLGAAFQKINFLRDLQSDYLERGRVYFPAVDFSKFNPKDKIQIESEIASDFSHAFEGIKQLIIHN